MYPQSSSCCSSGVSKGNPENRIIECGSITLIVFVVMPALSKIPRVMQAHGKSDPKFHEWSFRLVTPRDHQQAGKCEANYCFAAGGTISGRAMRSGTSIRWIPTFAKTRAGSAVASSSTDHVSACSAIKPN